jgi:hypothetical protein
MAVLRGLYGSVLNQTGKPAPGKPGLPIFSVEGAVSSVTIIRLTFYADPALRVRGIAATADSNSLLRNSTLRENNFLLDLEECIDTPMVATRSERNEFGQNGGSNGPPFSTVITPHMNTDAINCAIQKSPNKGARYFKAGVYNLTGSLTLMGGRTYVGAGSQDPSTPSILKQTASTDSGDSVPIFKVQGIVFSVAIGGLTFDAADHVNAKAIGGADRCFACDSDSPQQSLSLRPHRMHRCSKDLDLD